jgi:hypothetical protein
MPTSAPSASYRRHAAGRPARPERKRPNRTPCSACVYTRGDERLDRVSNGGYLRASIVDSNGNLYCPRTPRPLLELGPLSRAAAKEQAADHDRKTAELARYKLGRHAADGYHRVQCPTAADKIRCPLRPASMTLDRDRPEILQPPEHPPACRAQQTITVPPAVLAKTAQKHDYPSAAWRRTYSRRTGAERGFATVKDPAASDIARGWCRLMGLAPLTHLSSPRPCSSSATSASCAPGTPGRKKPSAAQPKGCPRKPANDAAKPSPPPSPPGRPDPQPPRPRACARHHIYQGLRPELTERQDPGPILMAVGILAGKEDDRFLQAGAESLFQEAQAVQIFAANAGSRLDLEGDDLAVIALEDEVYFVAALGPEVPDSYRGV